MEFDKSRVYTALNADELKPGDKVIVADDMTTLKMRVKANEEAYPLDEVCGEDWEYRFCVIFDKASDLGTSFSLAYLIERAENCTNCGARWVCPMNIPKNPKLTRCSAYETLEPKTEQKAEKKYRPFKDCDELIKVWDEKTKPYRADTKLPPIIMPLIWVQVKKNGRRFALADLDERILGYLFSDCTFLDGSPCGVEE